MAGFNMLLLMLTVGWLNIIPGMCQDQSFEVVFSVPRHNLYEIIDNGSYDPTNAPSPCVLLTTTSLVPVICTLMVPGIGFKSTHSITRYQHADVALPTAVYLDTGDGKQNKTVLVRASDTVSVHVMDNDRFNHDGFLALPSSSLGTNYYVASYTPSYSGYPSSFCVTALNEITQVEIITRSGQEHQITLSAYESYRFDGASKKDLTGTSIRANNRVAVISGIETEVKGNIYSDGDSLLEQLIPVHAWDRTFILSPFMGRSSGYVYRVITANMSATLQISNIDGDVQLSTDDGFYEGDVADNAMLTIISDNPVSVVQYMKDHYSDDSGDPSMIIVPGLNLYTNNITFPVFQSKYDASMTLYINILISCTSISGLIFDDQKSVAEWDRLTTQDKCSVRGGVTTGVHSLAHTDPAVLFSVAVYQVSSAQTSYMYPAAIALSNVIVPSSTSIPQITTDSYSTFSTTTEPEASTHISTSQQTRVPTVKPKGRPETIIIAAAGFGGGSLLLIIIVIIIVVALHRNKSSNKTPPDTIVDSSYMVPMEKLQVKPQEEPDYVTAD